MQASNFCDKLSFQFRTPSPEEGGAFCTPLPCFSEKEGQKLKSTLQEHSWSAPELWSSVLTLKRYS